MGIKKGLRTFSIILACLSYFLGHPPFVLAQEVLKPKVLFVAFDPVENGRSMAEEFFPGQLEGKGVDGFENYLINKTVNSFKQLSNNLIQYEVVKKIRITDFPIYPNGFIYDFNKYRNCLNGDPGGVCEQQKRKFPYIQWTKDYHICEIADANNVDEIWIISAPYIMDKEYYMIGPSHAQAFWGGEGFNVPNCKKHYFVTNPGYNAPYNFLHDIGHRIEWTMASYGITGDWKNEDRNKYWENFAATARYNQPYGQELFPYSRTYCGNAHFPPNARKHYDYSHQITALSNCSDWGNFPDFVGSTEEINCHAWGCSDWGWQQYWFSHIPKSEGTITLVGKSGKSFSFRKNWWYYLLFAENAIREKFSQLTPIPISTITPSPCAKPNPDCQGVWDCGGPCFQQPPVKGECRNDEDWCYGGCCCACRQPTPIISPSNTPTKKPTPTKTPTPIPFCFKCASGVNHALGNANCDSKVDLIDFAMWQGVYAKILKGEAVAEAEKAKVDFNCQEPNYPVHKVDLIDFNILQNNYKKGL